MSSLGYRVLTASDGRKAVERFRSHADIISLVIMNLSMPHLDGLSAAAEIRKLRPDVAVLLSSGYSEEEAARKLASAGALFIQKPYDLELLRSMLAQVSGA